MGRILNVMLNCKEVARSIATDELQAAGWRQRLAVRIHLLMCRHCRRYSRQIREIGDAAQEIFGKESLHSASRDRLRDSILDRLPTNQKDDSDPGL